MRMNSLILYAVAMTNEDAVVIKVSDRTWNDGSISANLGIILPTQVYNVGCYIKFQV